MMKRILHDNERGKDEVILSEAFSKDRYFSVSASFYLNPKLEIGTKVKFEFRIKGNKEEAF